MNRSILPEIRCPHCWETFAPQTLLYISQHPELLGDFRLGVDQPMRFLPTRFRSDGSAIDAGGFPSRLLACPRCHREIPRVLTEVPMAYFASVCSPCLETERTWDQRRFLVSMIHSLRRILPRYFAIHLTDADTQLNLPLLEYESIGTSVTASTKPMTGSTAESADMPRPFLFAMTPGKEHPCRDQTSLVSRVLCYYDPWTTPQMTRLLSSGMIPLMLFWVVTPTAERLRQDADSIETLGKMLAGPTPPNLLQRGPVRLCVIVPSLETLGYKKSVRQTEMPSVWKYAENSSVATLRSTVIDTISSQTCKKLRSLCPTLEAAVTRWFPEAIYLPVRELNLEEMTSVVFSPPSQDAEEDTEQAAPMVTQVTERMVEAALPMLWAMAISMQGVIQRTHSKKR